MCCLITQFTDILSKHLWYQQLFYERSIKIIITVVLEKNYYYMTNLKKNKNWRLYVFQLSLFCYWARSKFLSSLSQGKAFSNLNISGNFQLFHCKEWRDIFLHVGFDPPSFVLFSVFNLILRRGVPVPGNKIAVEAMNSLETVGVRCTTVQ